MGLPQLNTDKVDENWLALNAGKSIAEKSAQELEEIGLKLEQAPCPVTHHFYPGMYIREIFFPAGLFAMSATHKRECLNVFIKGKVMLFNGDGSQKVLEAPAIFMTPPGRKHGLILEDTVWLNVFTTDERDIEKLEEMLFEKSDAAKEANSFKKPVDTGDYPKMLLEIGVTDEMIHSDMEAAKHLEIPFPFGSYQVCVSDSSVHGKGLFATGFLDEGYLIPARINGKKTPAGRYTNHSDYPNLSPVNIGNDLYFEVIGDVAGMSGGISGDELFIDYREVLKCQQQ